MRKDFQELDRLLGVLSELERSDAAASFYVLGGSIVINDELLRTRAFQDGFSTLPGRILTTHHVDKRDGMPLGLLYSDYVIVTDPVQLMHPPAFQQVIEKPASRILSGTGLGRYYTRLPVEFHLDGTAMKRYYYLGHYPYLTRAYDYFRRMEPYTSDDVRVYIYRKKTGFSREDLESFLAGFRASYPEYPGLFPARSLFGLVREKRCGDVWGRILLIPGSGLQLFPGETTPSSVSFGLDKAFRRLTLVPHVADIPEACRPGGGIVEFTVLADGEVRHRAVYESGASRNPVTLDLTGVNLLELSAGNYGSPACDWFYVTVLDQD